MKVLLVDAYDSFTHIIDQYYAPRRADRGGPFPLPDQRRVDRPATGRGGARPGPGHPAESGHVELVHAFAGQVPLLGVCLGHQAIGLAYGGSVAVARHLMHGKTSVVGHDGRGVFAGASAPLTVTRYHSLIVADPAPPDLEVTARSSDDGYVMGVRHLSLPVEGVQFHPESVLTEDGLRLFDNFLRSATALPVAGSRAAGSS